MTDLFIPDEKPEVSAGTELFIPDEKPIVKPSVPSVTPQKTYTGQKPPPLLKHGNISLSYEAMPAFLDAEKEVGKIYVEDSYRPLSVQAKAYYGGKKGVASPEISKHPKGLAIDLNQGIYESPNSPAYIKTKNALAKRGWHPIKGEWWHFDYKGGFQPQEPEQPQKEYKKYEPVNTQLKLKKPETLTQPEPSYPTHPHVIPASVKPVAGIKNIFQGMLDSAEKYGNIQKFITGANANPFAYQIPMSPEEKSVLAENPAFEKGTRLTGEILSPADLLLFSGITKAIKPVEKFYKLRKGTKDLSLLGQMAKGATEMGAFSGISGALQGKLPTSEDLLKSGFLGAVFPVAGKVGSKLGGITKNLKEPFEFEKIDPFKGWSDVPANKQMLIYEEAVTQNKALMKSYEKGIKGRNFYKAEIEKAVSELAQATTEKMKKEAQGKLAKLNSRLASSETEIKNISAKMDKNNAIIEQGMFPKYEVKLPDEPFLGKTTKQWEAEKLIEQTGATVMPEKQNLTLPSREGMPIPEGGITSATVKVTTPSIVTQKDVMDDVASFAEKNPEILAPYFKLEGKNKLKYEGLLLRGEYEAAHRFLTKMTNKGNLPRITTIASEMIRKGEISLDMLPSVKKLIAEHGGIFDEADAAQWLLAQTKIEARGLGTQTAPAFRLREAALGMNLPNNIPLTVWDRIKLSQSQGLSVPLFLQAINAPTNQQVMGFWKYVLTSRFATQARNYGTTQYLMGVKLIEDAAVDTVSALSGKTPVKDALAASWENLSAMTIHLDRRGAAKIMSILEANPYQKERLFGRLGDISRGGPVSRLLNPAAEIQEFGARKQVMAATLWRDLRKAGLDPLTVSIADVPPDMIEHAVDEALRLTFASEPTKNTQAFIKMLTFYPDDAWYKVIAKTVGNVSIPFPRFMAENMKMMYETTPFALLYGVPKKILEKAPQEVVVRTAAKGVIGSTMFGMAWYIRNNPELRGENWYQVKVNGKNFDMRPFPLLSTYLFIADALDTYNKNGADALFKKYQMRDLASVALGMNRIGGTTMFMADLVHGQNMDGFVANIKKLSGEFIGGFTMPAQNIGTAITAFRPEEKKLRTTREDTIFGKAISNIPVLSQRLPQQPSIFGEGGKIKDRPLFGKEENIQGKLFGTFQRMIGLVGKEEPELEKEMNRLGMKIFFKMPTKNDLRYETIDLSQRYGIPPETLKRMLAEKMDEAMQKPEWIQKVKMVLSDPQYENMDDESKMEALSHEIFTPLKKDAKDMLFTPLEKKYKIEQKQNTPHAGGIR